MRTALWIRRLAVAGLLATASTWAQAPGADAPPPPPRRAEGEGPGRGMERGEFLKWLKENHPDEARRIAEFRETDPDKAQRATLELARKYRQQIQPDGQGQPDGDRRPQGQPGAEGGDHDFGRILRQLRESDPARYEELSRLREEDPQAFRRTMQDWFRENYPDYVDQNFGAERRSQEVARRYHDAATDADKAALEPELRAAVEAAFDERLKIQQQRVDQMEQQLATLRAQLAARAEKKQVIVDARVAELKADPLPAPRESDSEKSQRPRPPAPQK
jgi:hypothetical protein